MVKEFIEKEGLCDVWRLQNPEKRVYTWCRDGNHKGRISASHIDMILINQEIADCVTECEISSGHKTDHSLVSMAININEQKRGLGVWKLNNKWLQDNEYKELIKDTIQYMLQETCALNACDRWSQLKVECA